MSSITKFQKLTRSPNFLEAGTKVTNKKNALINKPHNNQIGSLLITAKVIKENQNNIWDNDKIPKLVLFPPLYNLPTDRCRFFWR